MIRGASWRIALFVVVLRVSQLGLDYVAKCLNRHTLLVPKFTCSPVIGPTAAITGRSVYLYPRGIRLRCQLHISSKDGTMGANAVQVVIVDTPGLGDRGYIVHDGLHAMVIDPQRDTDRIDELIFEHNLTVTHVADASITTT